MRSLPTSLLVNSFTRVAVFCSLLVIGIASAFFLLGLIQITMMEDNRQPEPTKVPKYDWKNLNPYLHILPTDVKEAKHNVIEKTAFINILGIRMFYREYYPPPNVEPTHQILVFLHGRSYSSGNWARLGTSALMAAIGHHVVAVDLPGFGKTGGEIIDEKERPGFLHNIITSLNLESPVLVAPSMSGSYSLPFLPDHGDELSGFIAIAPTSTNVVPQEILATVQVPTMAVVGSEDDTGLAEQSMLNFQILPNLIEVEIPGASHAAYESQPQLFHTAMYNFLLAVKNYTMLSESMKQSSFF